MDTEGPALSITSEAPQTSPGPGAPRPAYAGKPSPDDVPALGVWEVLGKAVLGFHYRVALTAMCQCGRTVVECDVQHHARRLGLLPPLPKIESTGPPRVRARPGFPLPPTPPGQTWPSQP